MDINEKRLFLLDLDGTLYLDDILFDGVTDFLRHIKEIGGRSIFMTNNSSRSVDSYVAKLRKIGIDNSCDDVLTSTQATAQYLLKHHADRLIYALGTRDFCAELKETGLNITDKVSSDVGCLVMGFDTELCFIKLDDASRLLTMGVDYIASNPDLVCPTHYGYVPDCGSVAVMLENATGRKPLFIGKPMPDMAYMALERTGMRKNQTLIVGDRLYTDIACGVNAKIDTALVLSGETTKEMLKDSQIKPTAVYGSVRDIFSA